MKIEANELHRLGNPTEYTLSETESMLDLVSLSGSKASNELVIFVLTSANSSCTTGSKKGSVEEDIASFSNKEMIDFITNEDEDGLTSFNAAMLINIGSVERVQTELYNSGASCHMSLYQDHFENYTFITPKSITAADKHYFQAIGKGDL